MFLQPVDLTPALRPSLLPGESLLFVQDGVGLYEGKYKIPHYQNGQVYLTSHRACYVDNEEPRRYAVSVSLKDVDRYEFYAGFLKSSAKISVFRVKAAKPLSLGHSPRASVIQDSPVRTHASSPAPRPNANWICPICGFANAIPADFDPANSRTLLDKCKLCGTPPEFIHVVKAALAAGRQPLSVTTSTGVTISPKNTSPTTKDGESKIQCPRCTFDNHPYLLECEQCGTLLTPVRDPRLDFPRGDGRTPSPGPTMSDLSIPDDSASNIKFSFRVGGEKVFYERLKSAMVQRKWLLKGAPPVPTASELGNGSDEGPNGTANRLVGIAGLELRGQEARRNNERLIGSSFEDLEALMTSAKEIVALAESFSAQSRDGAALDPELQSLVEISASALGFATTKDLLGSDALYISELSRNLAEFLMDDSKGVLKKSGGVMTLVDVWAIFNRIRNGVELVSPSDFQLAAQMWEKLKLPIRLRQFKSGLLVVQGTDRTEEKVIFGILAWLKEIRDQPPPESVAWDWSLYGRGVTVHEVAAKFGWSIGITTEELEMAEERGIICREQTLGGIMFWANYITKIPIGDWN